MKTLPTVSFKVVKRHITGELLLLLDNSASEKSLSEIGEGPGKTFNENNSN